MEADKSSLYGVSLACVLTCIFFFFFTTVA